MKRCTILCVEKFPEVLRAVSNASSNKGYQIWLTNKMKGGEVSCVVCAVTDGIIQGKGAFYAKLVMVDIDENGQEHPVSNPSGWARKISMPSYFADTVFQLSENCEKIFLTIFENEVEISNEMAEVKIPLIDNYDVTKGPADLRVCKFSVDRKTLLNKVRKIQTGSHKTAKDTLTFRVNKDGMMELLSAGKYIIPKSRINVHKLDTPENPFEGVSMCSVSMQKLSSVCNIEAEKLEFHVYMDDTLNGKLVTAKLDKDYDFLLNTKGNPSEIIFDYPDNAAASYLYRMKINAKDLRKALSILSLGQKDKIKVNLLPVPNNENSGEILIRDLQATRKVLIPYGEFEGCLPEEGSAMVTGLEVLNTSCAPFDETITISHTGADMLFMTDGNVSIVSTFAEVPEDEQAAEDSDTNAEADDGYDDDM